MSLTKKEVESLLILKTVDGSHCYGTNTEHSDVDITGVFVLPDDGLFQAQDEYREKSPNDLAYYNLKKIMKLLWDCNPNCSDLLFCKDEHILHITEKGRLLRDNRMLFVSANARHRYAGYAHSQIKRMRNHNRWIINPQPEEVPNVRNFSTFIDCSTGRIIKGRDIPDVEVSEFYPVKYNMHVYSIFEFCENPKVKRGIFDYKTPGAVREHDSSLMSNIRYTMIVDRVNFDKALDDHKNYWNWKLNRNAVRAELEEKFEFDTKHAAHAIRLMRMGLEILKFGVVDVYRHADKDELLSIRNGAWTYEAVLEEAKRLDDEAEAIYVNKTYKVPHSPDKVKINELYKTLMEV